MPTFNTETISIENLLLDPNNYRFHDDPNYVEAAERRYHEDSVQERVWRKLRDDGLLDLKNSIITNGFIPVEPLVVREYPYQDEKYVVIEGNRRLAALRWIKNDIESGVEIAPEVEEMLQRIPAVIVTHESDEPAFFEALMGVRHVSGIKQWGGYQRANLVVVLKDERNMDTDEIADRLGMPAREVNRRYRAFKALEQMKQDEEYGDHAGPDLYAIFHETISVPQIRTWLGWSDSDFRFLDENARNAFYDLITPNDPEEYGYREPKLRTYADVRELRNIIPNEDSLAALLDPGRSFIDAVAIAKEAQISRGWAQKINSAMDALSGLGWIELMNLNDNDLEKLERLSQLALNTIEGHKKLKEQDA